jgi:hypothetical protein
MSVWKNPPDGKTERRNKMGSNQWCARPLDLLESPAYMVLSRGAHQVVSRIEIELRHHGGRDNGKLPVTFDDFIKYGIHRNAIAPAIRELEAVGIIRAVHGRAGNAEFRIPSRFFQTYANERDGKKSPPPNDWRKIKSIEEAELLVRAARASKNPAAIERGRQSWHKKQNKFPVSVSVPARYRKPIPKPEIPGIENRNYRPGTETDTTIDISGGPPTAEDTAAAPPWRKTRTRKPADKEAAG